MPEPTSPADRLPYTDDELRASTVGELTPLAGKVEVDDYNPEWPRLFEREAARITGTPLLRC